MRPGATPVAILPYPQLKWAGLVYFVVARNWESAGQIARGHALTVCAAVKDRIRRAALAYLRRDDSDCSDSE